MIFTTLWERLADIAVRAAIIANLTTIPVVALPNEQISANLPSFRANLPSFEAKTSIYATSTKSREIPPILRKIAYCESGDRHFDENGNVLRGKINPADIGRYQLNAKYHQKIAESMGLDIYDENDNEAYALWLYKRQGVIPWLWSKKCWSQYLAKADNL